MLSCAFVFKFLVCEMLFLGEDGFGQQEPWESSFA